MHGNRFSFITAHLAVTGCFFLSSHSFAQSPLLEKQLAKEKPAVLAAAARKMGSPNRGAFVFYQPVLTCAKCHSTGEKPSPLGPDLSTLGKKATGEYVVESLLQPSKSIKEEYVTSVVVTTKGNVLNGLLVPMPGKTFELRTTDGKSIRLKPSDIAKTAKSNTSLMPAGLVNQLNNRQQFLDVVAFLMDIAEGGAERAAKLRPPESFFALPPLPAYEKNVDHAGIISTWNGQSLKRGKAIYEQVCANCHGTKDKPGSLPTSLRFAEGKFKNGSDPHSMYQTLTHGYGMMIAQRQLVPLQKYDVIHYIREAYLKPHNASQFANIDSAYLAKLPKGNTFGPKPSNVQPWVAMNYGPKMTATYEIGNDGTNFAYKGIAIRLDPGPGGVSRGRHWLMFDLDTFRTAAVWAGDQFMDYNAIAFNGRHAIHPRITGAVQLSNPTGPGWANPQTGDFKDVRLVGRDGRRYGPLPKSWAKYRGTYHFGNRVIMSYTVGKTAVLEMPSLEEMSPTPIYSRTFHIGPRDKEMILQVAKQSGAYLTDISKKGGDFAMFGKSGEAKKPTPKSWSLNGATYFEIVNAKSFDMRDRDYTIVAKIKTRKGGTIFCKTAKGPKWVPDGTTFFVRGGRLSFDIGWVGVVTSKRKVNDGKWHDVAMTYEHKNGQIQLFIDGKLDKTGRLKPKSRKTNFVARIGFTAPNFPKPQSHFVGAIEQVRFYSRILSSGEIAKQPTDQSLVGFWRMNGSGDALKDQSGNKHLAKLRQGDSPPAAAGYIVAGLHNDTIGMKWINAKGNLRLKIPAGKMPLRFTVSFARTSWPLHIAWKKMTEWPQHKVIDLTTLTQGGPPRWPEKLHTKATIGSDDGPFAVDVLHHPAKNPWSCRMRLTGFDFFPDGKRAVVCTWDGSVFFVDGVDHPEKGLTWQRIASGLFQPLGLKIVDGEIYVACRDQIVILRDLNSDGETDFYDCFNSDHQVTDHFHEFAMGLQTDDRGNFYYARGARHALKALVPHHGTLLRVSKDGSKTDILATGFRAPNGVCVNPDGTFFVTDQEGHWNPKNRINWVKIGGFYGNMWGYHDVTDTSDDAMQKPLCWITNRFDRSPAELMWVKSKKWGPLNGALLNLSYGQGKIFVVPHEKIGGEMQGGMVALPIPTFPTGVMRGRFHPTNGQLYACGMFAWAGNQQQPGGFYRIRYTDKAVHLPIGMNAKKGAIALTFSGKLDAKHVANGAKVQVRVWHIKRSARYGSKHFDERSLKVGKLKLSEDGRTLWIAIPDLAPTRCIEIRYTLCGAGEQPVVGVLHGTVHRLREE